MAPFTANKVSAQAPIIAAPDTPSQLLKPFQVTPIQQEWEWRSARIMVRHDFRHHPERREKFNEIFWHLVEGFSVQNEIHAIHWAARSEHMRSCKGDNSELPLIHPLASRGGSRIPKEQLAHLSPEEQRFAHTSAAHMLVERYVTGFLQRSVITLYEIGIPKKNAKHHLGSLMRESIDLLRYLHSGLAGSVPKDALRLPNMQKKEGWQLELQDVLERRDELREFPCAARYREPKVPLSPRAAKLLSWIRFPKRRMLAALINTLMLDSSSPESGGQEKDA